MSGFAIAWFIENSGQEKVDKQVGKRRGHEKVSGAVYSESIPYSGPVTVSSCHRFLAHVAQQPVPTREYPVICIIAGKSLASQILHSYD